MLPEINNLEKIAYSCSMNPEWLHDYADNIASVFGVRPEVDKNTLILPSAIGEGYIRHWNIGAGITAVYWDLSLNKQTFIQQNLAQNENLYAIFIDLNENGGKHVLDQLITPMGTDALYSAFYSTNNQPTGYIVSAGNNLRCLQILIDENHIIKLMQEHEGASIKNVFSKNDFCGYLQIDKKIFQKIEDFNPSKERTQDFIDLFYAKGKVCTLLSLFLELIINKNKNVQAPSPFEVNGLITLNETIKNEICIDVPSIALAAKSINVSVTKFKNLQQEIYNISFGKYHKEQRLNKAKDLLLNAQTRITEVAIALGYTNSSHFARSFRQRFGVTPKDYQKLHATPLPAHKTLLYQPL